MLLNKIKKVNKTSEGGKRTPIKSSEGESLTPIKAKPRNHSTINQVVEKLQQEDSIDSSVDDHRPKTPEMGESVPNIGTQQPQATGAEKQK